MTDLQVRARANEIEEEKLKAKREELAIKQFEAEEVQRANMAKEALTEAADRARFGYTTYMDPSWSKESNITKNPQTWWNVVREVLLGPLGELGGITKNIFGSMK